MATLNMSMLPQARRLAQRIDPETVAGSMLCEDPEHGDWSRACSSSTSLARLGKEDAGIALFPACMHSQLKIEQ